MEVLQSDGGNYCACANAATLALVDAGIPMRDYVCACTASLMNEVPLVDVSNLVRNFLRYFHSYRSIAVGCLGKHLRPSRTDRGRPPQVG